MTMLLQSDDSASGKELLKHSLSIVFNVRCIKYEIALLNFRDSISVCTINIRSTGYNIIFKLREQVS